jgi:hypothetical protein
MSGIYLDPKHGVNAGMMNCFFCNEPKGLILHGQIKPSSQRALREAGIHVSPDGEAPRNLVIDMEPCDKCKGYMEMGVLLISVREPKTKEEETNPYRTGGWVVVRDEAIERIVQQEELRNDILKKRMAFIPDDAWDAIGLPRGAVEESSECS